MPSTFRFLHAADLHLDSPLRGLEDDAPVQRIRTATRAAYTNLVDLALREQVAFVVIAGDVFDGEWLDWRTGQFFTGETLRLTRAGIRVVAIRGNHDAQSVISHHLALPDGARMLGSGRPEQIRFAEYNVCIHGQGFATREVTENLALGYPAPFAGHFNIGLLHTAASGRPGHATYAPCSVEQLVGHGYDYWALGHVHTREVLARAPWIVFPGNIQGRHVNEPGPKGATLVTVRDGQVADATHCDLDVVRWGTCTLDLSGLATEEEVLAAARRRLADAVTEAQGGGAGRLLVLRLVLTGACGAHPGLVRDTGVTREKLLAEAAACAGPDELWLESVQVRTTASLDMAGLRARDDVVGLLVRTIEANAGDDRDAAGAIADKAGRYCSALLDRASLLRGVLGDDHAAVRVAAGALPRELVIRARDLLLARLAEGR